MPGFWVYSHIDDVDDVDGGGGDDDDGGFVGGGGGGGGGIDVTRPASATSTFKSALEGPCLVCLVDNSQLPLDEVYIPISGHQRNIVLAICLMDNRLQWQKVARARNCSFFHQKS